MKGVSLLIMSVDKAANSINILGKFLGMRDLTSLSNESLKEAYGIEQADLLILYGGCIPEGCDVAGQAFQNGIAKHLMISGGEGHTTESLRQKIHQAYPQIETSGKMEAEVMAEYINLKYGIKDIMIEKMSTNCGNNVTYSLDIIAKSGLKPKSIIVIQDSTMQRRMDAGFRKFASGMTIINWAPYIVDVISNKGNLEFTENSVWGLWDLERYITLLMGEIPRLTDDENGYGPNGKDFISHVEIPSDVKEAFEYLKKDYGSLIRAANPAYASK